MQSKSTFPNQIRLKGILQFSSFASIHVAYAVILIPVKQFLS